MLIQKTDILCNVILQYPEERVRYIVDHIEEFYGEFRQFKKDKQGNKRKNKAQYITKYGKYWSRVINPPKHELKLIQKRINAYLVENIPLPNYAFGGIKTKDNILNAFEHKGKKYVFQTDLKDFFPRITNKMVYKMFVENSFSPDVATLLTKLTTFQGHLPQGAPTSTTIANLVFVPVGNSIQSVAEREGLHFTTFVDDVTVSSQNDFKSVIPEMLTDIQSAENGQFKISHGKTSYKSGSTVITGVKMLKNSMTIPDKLRERMNIGDQKDSPRVRGLENYAKRIKKISARKK